MSDPTEPEIDAHPSQAEGEDPREPGGVDTPLAGHPSQAEGEDPSDTAAVGDDPGA